MSSKVIAVIGVLLFLGGLGAAAANRSTGAVSTGTGSPEQWAYGANTWYNTTSITSSYDLHEVLFYGTQVVTTATNTSKSTIEITALHASAFTESYVYCAPNCTTPSSAYYNLSLDEWSSQLSYINLTANAQVFENNSSVKSGLVAAPAYGITNATWVSGSNYSERYVYDLQGTPDYKGTDFSQTNSTYKVVFHPALGLIPWKLSKNLTWNATSNATASYLAKTAYSVTYNGRNNYTIVEYGNAYTQWNIPETEWVMGEDLGNSTLASGGNVTKIELGFSGGLDVSDGIFAAPVSRDLFGGATGNWSVGVVAGALSKTTALSVSGGGASGGYRIVASDTAWSASIRMVGLRPGSYAALPTPIAAPSSGNSRAEPETVPFAQSEARCLVNSCGIAPGASLPIRSGGFEAPVWIVRVIGGGALAALVALAFLWRRRARPAASTAPPKTEAEPSPNVPR